MSKIIDISRSRRMVAAVLAAGLLLPPVFASPAGGADDQGGRPQFFSNSIKYREKDDAKPARGRAGSAELFLRALMGKESVGGLKPTDVEMRTNDFESPVPPPGTISKLQVKAFDVSRLLLTDNSNNLQVGGSHTLTFSTLERGNTVQVQANIRGIDPRRTDLVTVRTMVKLRPDVAVADIHAPNTAHVGTAVNISGTLIEKNGDVGARADCLLLVDDKKVDAAPKIWVDAGGTVSCTFTHRFETSGKKTLKVVADRVNPGDFDTTNNSATVTIQITEPTSDRPFWYYAYASDYEFLYRGTDQYTYQYSGTYTSTGTRTYAGQTQSAANYSGKGWYQFIYFYGQSPDRWTFPIQKVSASLSLDGATLHTVTATELPLAFRYRFSYTSLMGSPWSYTVDSSCASKWLNYYWLYLCVQDYSWNGYSFGGSYVQYGRSSGDVTYHSDGWIRYWYQYEAYKYSGYYTWNYDFRYAFGPPRLALTPTSAIAFDVTVMDDGRRYQGAPKITSLRAYEQSYSSPSSCYSYAYTYSFDWIYPPPPWGNTVKASVYGCSESSSWYKGLFGWAWGRSGPW